VPCAFFICRPCTAGRALSHGLCDLVSAFKNIICGTLCSKA
jgi:hypothetical protein